MTERGKFIVIEGPDGSGKTTQLEILESCFDGNTLFVSESIDTGFGKELKKKLLVAKDPVTFLRLKLAYYQDRLENLILPNIEKGNWVFCHRHTLSIFVYQSRVYGACSRKELETMIAPLLIPDLLVYLDLEPNASRARVISRYKDKGRNFVEPNPRDYFEKVAEGYHSYFSDPLFSKKSIRIDAFQPSRVITDSILRELFEPLCGSNPTD